MPFLASELCNFQAGLSVITYHALVDTVNSEKIALVHKRLCRVNFANLQKIDFCVFQLCELATTWSGSYTLEVAALIIANFNFASEAKR